MSYVDEVIAQNHPIILVHPLCFPPSHRETLSNKILFSF